MADDPTTFIVSFPIPDADALDTALRECPTDNEMLFACLFAAEELVHLRAALALAVGELSTHAQYAAWTPDQLMNQFLEEAHRG